MGYTVLIGVTEGQCIIVALEGVLENGLNLSLYVLHDGLNELESKLIFIDCIFEEHLKVFGFSLHELRQRG